MAKSNKRRHAEAEETPPDFELVFKADGTVELLDDAKAVVWASDSDDDFAEAFDGDFFSDEDADEILDYLNDEDYVDLEVDEIDIVENDLADEVGSDADDGDDNVIDAEFTVLDKGRRS